MFLDLLIVSLLSAGIARGQIADVLEMCAACVDVSHVTWAHGVNSKELLDHYINDSSTLMLEADVTTGRHLDDLDAAEAIPIMAHPPNVTSDVSLEEFMDIMISVNKKGSNQGIKLDFKDITAVRAGMEILQKKEALINFPLWLNADILEGPGAQNSTPVDPQFLSLSKKLFPKATLSIGWTTSYNTNDSVFYTMQMVTEMIDIIKAYDITQAVTFPIRASYVNRSLKQIKYLLDSVPGSTLTIWTGSQDIVEMQSLVQLQDMAGFNKVYFDLPTVEMKMLKFLRLVS